MNQLFSRLASWIKNNYQLIILTAVIGAGIFLRLTHFSDWLHFELDQSRDAKVIEEAWQNGPSNLPLLGPRAGGTYLRLGPAFYYFEYLSAIIFGYTPAGLAAIVAILSILSIPLLYRICRFYYDDKISLAIVAIYSFSFYQITYSRFAWNPNPLPFFVLLIFLALLKVSVPTTKKRGWWFLLGTFALGIASQLHFLAMFALGLFVIAYLILARIKINWKIWLAAIALILVLYLPMIMNEIGTKGANTRQFFGAINKKATNHDNTLLRKIIQNYFEHASKYFLIQTGQEQLSIIKFKIPNYNPIKWSIACNKNCQKSLPYQGLSLIFFTFTLYVYIQRFRKDMNQGQHHFTLMFSLYLLATFLIFTPLALYLSPRFFLMTIPLPFFLIGFLLQWIRKNFHGFKADLSLTIATLVFIFSNLYYLNQHFEDLKSAPFKNKIIKTELILNERAKITLQQQLFIVAYMANIQKSNNYPIYLTGETQYQRSIIFHMASQNLIYGSIKVPNTDNKIYKNGHYFLIYLTNSNHKKRLAKFDKFYDVISKKQFGTLTVFQLKPKDTAVTDQNEKIQKKVKTTSEKVPKRFNWSQFWSN